MSKIINYNRSGAQGLFELISNMFTPLIAYMKKSTVLSSDMGISVQTEVKKKTNIHSQSNASPSL